MDGCRGYRELGSAFDESREAYHRVCGWALFDWRSAIGQHLWREGTRSGLLKNLAQGVSSISCLTDPGS